MLFNGIYKEERKGIILSRQETKMEWLLFLKHILIYHYLTHILMCLIECFQYSIIAA